MTAVVNIFDKDVQMMRNDETACAIARSAAINTDRALSVAVKGPLTNVPAMEYIRYFL